MLQSSTIRQRKAPPHNMYGPAGNILSKTVAGKTTTYTYDKANQLVSSKTADGKVTKYEYDAAGRMTKEGEKTFAYGWLDKVMQVAENGKTTQSYSYDISGQLATADYGDSKETFLWDGLALLSRNNLKYVNEPAVTGGNPILAGDKMLFDDMLGNTLGVKDGEKFSAIDRDAFGELKPGEKPNLAVNFFTGKPEIEGLGYSFLFRNYRADLGKWQTTDPLGYPDGWNNLAYVNNQFFIAVDPLGTVIEYTGSPAFVAAAKEAVKKIQSTPTGAEIVATLEKPGTTHTIKESFTNHSEFAPNDITTTEQGPGKDTTIKWNPRMDAAGSWPCPAWNILAHEMTHASEYNQGKMDLSIDPETQLQNSEISACREANRMLLENDPNADTRKTYDGKLLPPDAIHPTPKSKPE